VWRHAEGEPTDEPLYPFSGIVLSDDGRYAADDDVEGVAVRNLQSGETIMLDVETDTAELVFSPDSSRFAVFDLYSGMVELYTLPAGELLNSFQVTLVTTAISRSVSISPDNRLLAFTTAVRREPFDREKSDFVDYVIVVDLETGETLFSLSTDGEDQLLTGTTFRHDSQSVAVGRIGGVTVWDLAARQARRLNLPSLPADREEDDFRVVDSVTFSPDGTRVAALSEDFSPQAGLSGVVTIWDVESGEIIAQTQEPLTGFNLSLDFSPDGSELAFYNYTSGIHVWDMQGESQVLTNAHPADGGILAVSPDGTTLAAGGFDRTVRFWSLADGMLTESIVGHSSAVNTVTYAETGLFASASQFNTWILENGIVREIDAIGLDSLALAFSRDGETVYGISGQPTTPNYAARGWLYPVNAGEETDAEVFEMPIPAQLAAFDNRGERVALVNETEGVVLYTTGTSPEEVMRFSPEVTVSTLEFSPNDAALALGAGSNGEVAFWQLSEEEASILWQVNLNDSSVTAIAFTPDGSLIAVGTGNGAFFLLDAETGETVAELEHENGIDDLVFTPDGELLISSGGTYLKVWGVPTN
jgi:WD40 repeat protein